MAYVHMHVLLTHINLARYTPSVSKYKMFKHSLFPSYSFEPCTKTCLDTEEKKRCLNILYLGTEGVHCYKNNQTCQ